jgi:hypothetical protein
MAGLDCVVLFSSRLTLTGETHKSLHASGGSVLPKMMSADVFVKSRRRVNSTVGPTAKQVNCNSQSEGGIQTRLTWN